LPDYFLAYDADCGPCTRFKQLVDFLDRYHRIDFLSLTKAEELGLLDRIPQSLKFTSFHLISSTGSTWSGAEALPSLIDLLPLGHPVSKLIVLLPAGKRVASFIYSTFSRLHESGSCKTVYKF
jgi:predicted DCC family thiol-disulfide oxidoreductase YuxK